MLGGTTTTVVATGTPSGGGIWCVTVTRSHAETLCAIVRSTGAGPPASAMTTRVLPAPGGSANQPMRDVTVVSPTSAGVASTARSSASARRWCSASSIFFPRLAKKRAV
jgi:hypothetical protein